MKKTKKERRGRKAALSKQSSFSPSWFVQIWLMEVPSFRPRHPPSICLIRCAVERKGGSLSKAPCFLPRYIHGSLKCVTLSRESSLCQLMWWNRARGKRSFFFFSPFLGGALRSVAGCRGWADFMASWTRQGHSKGMNWKAHPDFLKKVNKVLPPE